VELPHEVVEDLRLRLKRAGGQVHAVETMLSEGRECRDIVTQLSAATKALEQVGFRLIASGLSYCIQHPEEAEESGYPLNEVQRLFLRLA
jgi:DNA-binding FrmR family transcriptional regulator